MVDQLGSNDREKFCVQIFVTFDLIFKVKFQVQGQKWAFFMRHHFSLAVSFSQRWRHIDFIVSKESTSNCLSFDAKLYIKRWKIIFLFAFEPKFGHFPH